MNSEKKKINKKKRGGLNKKIMIIGLIILFFILSIIVFKNFKSNNLNRLKIERTNSQLAHPELLIEDIQLGEGKEVQEGDKVILNYLGKLEDGTIFDSSYDKGKSFEFILGQGRVIPGWEIGIEKMKEGGKRRLTIPAYLAYGESGVRGMIPGNATIIFEIEVIEILR